MENENLTKATSRTCRWDYLDKENNPDAFEGECGAAWYFDDGGPFENDCNFCPRCGGKILFEETD